MYPARHVRGGAAAFVGVLVVGLPLGADVAVVTCAVTETVCVTVCAGGCDVDPHAATQTAETANTNLNDERLVAIGSPPYLKLAAHDASNVRAGRRGFVRIQRETHTSTRVRRFLVMDNDRAPMPNINDFVAAHLSGVILVTALVMILLFPTVAALVAPSNRRAEFFVLTLIILPGPLGVACASVAQSR
jgi:hypothetical protein